ncbi:hypothetical protein PsorP6_012661 [Peronosclerospora sorghi]|uniref:Uncharacterized protein n=1 Tax=Peronosclerospora sorghi TaxID=230839 RepID=A0ACC0WH42_9STRA|nr:hypothetical protein PsorP6_012661 [Peronosclerospora sorghi]
MKMASLMDHVKVDGTKKWTHRNASISISSLTTNDEPSHEVEDATSVFQDEVATTIEHRQEEKPREGVRTHEANGEIPHCNGHGDPSPGVRRSMYDFYFPTGKRTENSEGGMNRSLKRKRRTGRRMEELAVSNGADMLRFGVDVAKLVPEGLVDRVDVHMNRLVRIKVVSNHVTNWCNRSGFASSFLGEITTLLAAYYPCTYATLLDEVFAGFLLKRPEFMHLLLPAMLAKMRKTGESILTTKFPVTDALVRMCSVKTGPHALEQQNLV